MFSRKCVAILTVFAILSGLAFSDTARAGQTSMPDGLKKVYENIEPLQKKIDLRFMGSVGLQIAVPIYVAYATGAMGEKGVDLEFLPATTGPISVEALTAGEVDFIGTGIGGIAVGAANDVAKMLCYLNEDSVIQKFFVASDSPLAKAPFNPKTGFVGTADQWRGLSVYMAPGTTLQYLMGVALGKIGLTLQDIKPVYMDTNNVNTTLFAKRGDVWGIWNFLCYNSALKKEGFVPVVEGDKVGIHLTTAFATNDDAWNVPDKREAILKVMELHFATVAWMKASPENMRIAAKIATEWSEAEGTAVSEEENYAYLDETYYYNLEENVDFFQTRIKTRHGEQVKALEVLNGIMDFYIEQGNYTEADRENMVKNQSRNFPFEAIAELLKRRK